MKIILGYHYLILFVTSWKITTALVTPASGIKGGALVEELVIAKYIDGCSPLHFCVWQTNQHFLSHHHQLSTVELPLPFITASSYQLPRVAGVPHLKGLYHVTSHAINEMLSGVTGQYLCESFTLYDCCIAHIMQPLAICNFVIFVQHFPLQISY